MARILVLLAALTTSLAACGAEAQLGPATDVLTEMRGRQEGAASVRPFDSLADLLDNTHYQMGEAPARPLTEAVIVGQVTDVQPGRAFTDETDDAPDGTETDFGDPDAIWRSVHVSIKVETVVSGAVVEPVVVGFAFDPRLSVEDIRAQFVGFGSVLLFLNRSPVFDYDPEVYGTVLDGALLGVVDDEGHIALPLVDRQDAKGLLREASSVEELEAAAEGPERLVRLNLDGTVAGAALESDYEFEPYPGSRWYGPDGEPISEKTNIINAITGPDHCNWESAVMMHVGWPPGHDAADASESHQFIRDPEGVIDKKLAARFENDVTLPTAAENSGYRTDFMELWFDANDMDSAYLLFADHTERWPRANEVVACA